MKAKFQPWEFLAIDLIYIDKDPVTIALIPRGTPDLSKWMEDNIRPPVGPSQHIGVYAWPITLH
jgi:hypothetical protein